jgi:hypothetical protein
MCSCYILLIIKKPAKIRIHKTIILPVILNGCEIWSLTLREERRLRVLRRIFGPKRDEVTGGWRKLQIEVLHNFFSAPNINGANRSRRMRWVGLLHTGGHERCIQHFG